MAYSIKLIFNKDRKADVGCSKWWGAPDLPADHPYPVVPCSQDGDDWDEPLTFLCQIRCEDIASMDPDNLLPHEGMLYFFAAIDYFLGLDSPVGICMGEWERQTVRVIYSPTCEGLEPYEMHYDNGEDVFFPAEALSFELGPERDDSFKLLGKPFLDEINEQYENCVTLLQIDENDDWHLRFFDCGMLCILLSREDLAAGRWSSAFGYLHSF